MKSHVSRSERQASRMPHGTSRPSNLAALQRAADASPATQRLASLQAAAVQRAEGDTVTGTVQIKRASGALAIMTKSYRWFDLPSGHGCTKGDTVSFVEGADRAVTALEKTGRDSAFEVISTVDGVEVLGSHVRDGRIQRITSGSKDRPDTDMELVVSIGGATYAFHLHAPSGSSPVPIAGQVMKNGGTLGTIQTPYDLCKAIGEKRKSDLGY